MYYEDRVRRGAQLLDEYRPGWAEEIVAEDLLMNSCHWCILGQLYGDFFTGLDRLRSDGVKFDEVAHGFDEFKFASCDRDAWSALDDAWRAEIRARLGVEPERCP